MKILERINPTNTGSYNRPIAHALGLSAAVVYAALISKQVYYEQHNKLDEEGFFYSTIADLQESTTLTKRQQKDAIKVLIDKGLIKRKRCGMPAKRYFRVLDDTELIDDLLKQGEAIMNELNPIAQKCENVTSCSDKIVQQEVTNCNIKLAQNVPYTINHNINKSKENNPNLSIHGSADVIDMMDNSAEIVYVEERENYLELIRENIEYDCFEEKEQDTVDEYVQDFEKRNPNLKVFNAVMHLDESTPHLHIDFVPVAHKGRRGMSLKNSMSGALREQGFSSSNKMQNEWTAWSESERSVMEQILLKHGLRREDKNVHRQHMSVEDYKKAALKAEQINKLNAHINELKKKPVEELTPDEVTLIKNQNDFMRGEIINRNETISELSKQVNAKFVTVNIYSPDKLQYIADGLARAKISCVAESNTLYVPDYALKTAQAIASHYKPDEKAPTIREMIKLDIDRLVYKTETLDDLLYRLQERGYEVKEGKYISVKHPSAERFVRLKNLGDEYLPKNLEQRIAEKDMFTDRVRYEVQNANPIEKRFHITVLNVASAVKQFRLEPKKTDKRRYYFFQNDARINYLSEQLATIGEFGLTSRDSIYAKAQELQRTIHKMRSQGENPEEQENALKRINTLIKAYEEIVEGNYIDNLIKAQQEEKQAAEQNANAHRNAPKNSHKR